MKFLTFGFFHFFFQRNSTIFLIFLVINIFLFNSIFSNSLILSIVIFHLRLGFENLIEDYIHFLKFKVIGIILSNLVLVYYFKTLLITQ
jgi:succinate dehydrogenase hydrophobic anchor subunit